MFGLFAKCKTRKVSEVALISKKELENLHADIAELKRQCATQREIIEKYAKEASTLKAKYVRERDPETGHFMRRFTERQ